MTANEKRLKVRDKYRTIIGRNYYSQAKRDYCYKKYKDGKYYSDCSSSISYTYKEVGLSFGILNTVGMWTSKKLVDVPVVIKNGLIQNPEVLRIGDMLLFAGNDTSRKAYGYVGHVEMVGEVSGSTVMLYGHGSGNPKRHEMNAYCRTRYNTRSSTPLGRRLLIRVRRFIQDEAPVEPIKPEEIAEGYIEVSHGNYYVRTKADKNSAAIGIVREGDKIPYLGVDNNGWNKVSFGNKVGWLSSKAGEVIYFIKNAIKVRKGTWNIRTEPNSSSKKLGIVSGGTVLNKLVSNETGWQMVEYNGSVGWISDRAVE